MDPLRFLAAIVVGYFIGTLTAALLLAPVFLVIEALDRLRIRRHR